MKIKNIFVLLLLFNSVLAIAQIQDFRFFREIKDKPSGWRKIILPEDIFNKTSPDLRDIRIFGITEKPDTIEAPYVIQTDSGRLSEDPVQFKIINKTKRNSQLYYTFEIDDSQTVNKIDLRFNEKNFDKKILLEGSNDQKEWFTILENYRIISINNETADYSFTSLEFNDTKFRYLRLIIPGNEDLGLIFSGIKKSNHIPGHFKKHNHKSLSINHDKKKKETIIELSYENRTPVSRITLKVKDSIDYYRSFSLSFLTDSFKTEKGWKYNYAEFFSGTISSLQQNDFIFQSIVMNKLKIIIRNGDNQPLTFDSVYTEGNIYYLLARFNIPAHYYLCYGNTAHYFPRYDIENFISDSLTLSPISELADEKTSDKISIPQSEPLFKNKIWLWAIMGLIIAMLGAFTLKMIKNK